MDLHTGFTIGFLGGFGVLLVYRRIAWTIALIYGPVTKWLTRHLILRRVFDSRHSFNPTRAQVLGCTLHWTATLIYNIYAVETYTEAAKRAGQLAVLHLIPLLLSNQLACIARIAGSSLQLTVFAHSMLGLMMIAQSLLHCLLHILHAEKLEGATAIEIIAAATSLVLLLSPFARRHLYELFLYVHWASAIALVAALYLHLGPKITLNQILLMVGISIHVATWCIRAIWQAYHNLSHFKLCEISDVKKIDETLVIEISLSRPWKIRPGQYVHVTVLTWRSRSFLQRHPLTVAWWDYTGTKHKLFLVVTPEHGWTRNIFHDNKALKRQKVWLDGPFGRCYDSGGTDIGKYDRVLFLTSGMGIFAQLPLIKDILERSKARTVRTRYVAIVWETDGYNKQLEQWMEELDDGQAREQAEENDCLLGVEVFVFVPSGQDYQDMMRAKRFEQALGKADAKEYIKNELVNESGLDCAVVLSAHAQMRHDTTKAIFEANLPNVRLFQQEYQP